MAKWQGITGGIFLILFHHGGAKGKKEHKNYSTAKAILRAVFTSRILASEMCPM